MTALDIFVDHDTGPLASPRLEVRFPVRRSVDLDAATAVFQNVVAARPFDELLIDVTSYAHVSGGPGLLLVGQDVHYGLTDGPNATLSRTHRRPWGGHAAGRLAKSVDRTLHLAQILVDAFPSFELATDRVTVGILDRLRAPNTRSTFERVQPALVSFFTEVYREVPSIVPGSLDAAPFAVTVRTSKALTIEAIRTRLAELQVS